MSLENCIVKQHRDNPTHLLGELKSKLLTTRKAVRIQNNSNSQSLLEMQNGIDNLEECLATLQR